MKQKYNGFTLIELMVSVALMLIIIGMTMVIFNSTSTTFTVAEAKVDIMQNARLALDTIAKDIANATAISGDNIETGITIETVTSYWAKNKSNDNKIEKFTGKVNVRYLIVEDISFNDNKLYFLQRQIITTLDKNEYELIDLIQYIPEKKIQISASTIAEYLIKPNIPGNESTNATNNESLYFEYFMHPGTRNTNWNGPYPLLPYPPETNPPIASTDLPPLVRVTITVTDEHMNACRTLSRMIWIPKGIRRQ